MTISYIGIVGAGAWGTALAQVVRQSGCEAVLWAHEEEVAKEINIQHENKLFLPGIQLDPGIRATTILEDAAEVDAIFLAVPAQYLRSVIIKLPLSLSREIPAVVCAKGVELKSAALMSEVVNDALPGRPIAILSGPTFAEEVARGMPTAVTLAANDAAVGNELVEAIGNQNFRPYFSDDVTGAEIGGAVKNVLAIACGITDGRGLGNNARAAVITRGLVEMTRLCIAKGGRAETMMGLSGLGDLTLTCTSNQSRNYSLGKQLGKGKLLEKLLSTRLSVAEGVTSASAISNLAKKLNIEMPITDAVSAILDDSITVEHAIKELLIRPFRSEDPLR